MSKPISADCIIAAARRIADKYGLASISIRGVARECGISVGSLYNYFPSCDELVVATVNDLIGSMFYEDFCHPDPAENYLVYCERLFDSLRSRMTSPESNLVEQFQELSPGARIAGMRRMNAVLSHIETGLESVLLADPRANKSALVGTLSPHNIAKLTVSCMMDSLRANKDCTTFFAMLAHVLYEE